MKLCQYKEFFEDKFDLNEQNSLSVGSEIDCGTMVEKSSRKKIPIINGIPRFVTGKNYADNFGLQWNKFNQTQLDSVSKSNYSSSTFWKCTQWKASEMNGKMVLEAGSGAGRFTEVILSVGAKVISFDFSSAIDANKKNNEKKGDVLFYQGDIYDIPFPDEKFEYIFCYGVLQHTPDPDKAFLSLLSKLKKGGRMSVDYYRKMYYPSPWTTPKYLWRPLTTRIPQQLLLKVISWYIPRYLPIDIAIKKIPKIGSLIAGCIPIPCWNYGKLASSYDDLEEWAILGTFDALSAKFDKPQSIKRLKIFLSSITGIDAKVFPGANGIVINVKKTES